MMVKVGRYSCYLAATEVEKEIVGAALVGLRASVSDGV